MRNWMIMGVLATAVIALALPVYAFNETTRLAQAQTTLLNNSIAEAQVIYAENCVVCHGAAGAGIGTYPPLANEGVQGMAYDDLFKVIERGRYGTAMAAWGNQEGGVLNNAEIDHLIVMLQQGNWTQTAQTVAGLGLTPPTVLTVAVSAERLADLTALPHGAVLAQAWPLYAANCTGCHGAAGEGTQIAPALNSATLRDQKADAELTRIIANGVPTTLMAGWQHTLSAAEIEALVGLIRYWPELPAEAMPAAPPPVIASTDAAVIAAGQQLYGVVCATCHGVNGQGKPIAPALNSQTVLANKNDQVIKAIITQGVSNTRMPAWGGRLTDEQLNSLVSYLRSWEATAPVVAPTQAGQSTGSGPKWMRQSKLSSWWQSLWGN